MKMMKRLIVGGILLVLLIVGAGIFYIDQIAKTGIEEGATFALGTETSLASADIQFLGGKFKMAGMNVRNPKGFKADYFLKLGSGEVAVSLGSLMEDTVRIPLISLDGLDLLLEGKGTKTNAAVILENIGKLSSEDRDAKKDQPEQADEGAGKRFVIDEIAITNVSMRIVMPPISSADKPLVVNIPEIRLKDVGSDSDKGVLLSELTGIILSTTIRTIMENGGDILPQAILGSLDSALAGAGDLGKMGGELVGQMAQAGGQLAESATKAVDDVTEQVAVEAKKAADQAENQVSKLAQGVTGLLGGEEENEE